MPPELPCAAGPSPRGWGAQPAAASLCGCHRTIPTRVGSTLCPRYVFIGKPDHPHAGGEHERIGRKAGGGCGPSPRGWGAPNVLGAAAYKARTIPTRVGSTNRCAFSGRLAADHPHAGGEHWTTPNHCLATRGPSPRGWGAPQEPEKHCWPRRTIPTRVGSTLFGRMQSGPGPDHPHAGGEHTRNRHGGTSSGGPSPRGWGALYLPEAPLRDARTIPTRVGSTPFFALAAIMIADHPHAGGEHGRWPTPSLFLDGPSPRGWGAPLAERCRANQPRTIPTRVGSTG